METIVTMIMLFISQLFGLFGGGEMQSTTEIVVDPVMVEVVRVIDGDTIVVNLEGVEETVRYIGIDTPEPYRDTKPACFSAEASQANRELVAGKMVSLVSDAEDRDRYERLLRYVYVDDVFVNEYLVSNGYATTMTIAPNTKFATQLAAATAAAKAADLGLWSACVEKANNPQSDNDPTATATIETAQLTSGQRQLLEFLGINTSVLSISPSMIACAETAVGADRLAAITAGDTPSITEGIKLVSCYRQ